MQEWREELGKRRRSSKTKRLYIDDQPTRKFSCDATISPMHYEDAQGDLQDINAELVPSTRSIVGFGNPAHEMIENEYEMFVLGTLNSGVPLVRYVSKNTDYWVQFAAHNLVWTNDLDQIDFIATPQTTTTEVSGSEAKWPAAYGAGLDLRYIAGRGRMAKWLDIANPLPDPPQFIIDGGNPVIEFAEILEFHGDLAVYINGEEWNKRDDVSTATEIEFRANGEVQFVIPVATGYHEDPEAEDVDVIGQLRLKKQGNKLYVTARFSWGWLQTAVYPVHLDTHIDPQPAQVGASADDAWESSAGAVSIITTAPRSDHVDEWFGFRFTGITIEQGNTIDTSYLTPYVPSAFGDEPDHPIYGEDEDNPGIFAISANNISGRTRTDATVTWSSADLGAPDWFDSPELKTITQEVVDRGGWASGNAMVFVMRGSADGGRDLDIRQWDYTGNAHGCKLHIEYTAAAAGVPQQMMHYMRMRKE